MTEKQVENLIAEGGTGVVRWRDLEPELRAHCSKQLAECMGMRLHEHDWQLALRELGRVQRAGFEPDTMTLLGAALGIIDEREGRDETARQ